MGLREAAATFLLPIPKGMQGALLCWSLWRQHGWPWLFANHPFPEFPSLLLSRQVKMRAICLWLWVAQALLRAPLGPRTHP